LREDGGLQEGIRFQVMQSFDTSDMPYCKPGGEPVEAPVRRPVDLTHLSLQTGDDRELEREVLSIFIRSAEGLNRELQDLKCGNGALVAHQLKGASRAIGAFNLARCCEDFESNGQSDADRKRIGAELEAVSDYIASVLR
jgi:HPt (histidine-containing phosphotransfer) domain-containing protein